MNTSSTAAWTTFLWVLCLVALLATACGKQATATAAQRPSAVEVGVITVTWAAVPLTHELQGRTAAYRVAEVRARVNGIVLKRLFSEGSEVKANQPLFQIDPAPYQAALDSARASLARAAATREFARLQAARYEKLIAENVVSDQDYRNVIASHKTSEADVGSGRAAVELASINLGYTVVRSPVAGKIGRASVTEGAYVQQGQATLLATVQQLDPIYVDLTQSGDELLRLRRQLESGQLLSAAPGEAAVTVLFDDGSEYPRKGRLQFSDVTVDQSTGSVVLRAIVPNPERNLLPGMFVRARLEEGVTPQAILVPQVGLTRDPSGRAIALVVNAQKKVEMRQVKTDRAAGNSWVVTDGLGSGDQVIVEGMQKVRPGSEVVAVAVAEKSTQSAH